MIKSYEHWGDYVYKFEISPLEANEITWKETDEFPPLSPRKAIELGRKAIISLFPHCNDDNLNFEGCTLRQYRQGDLDQWHYTVTYFVPSEDGMSDASTFSVPVFFNSTVPTPAIYPYEERFDHF